MSKTILITGSSSGIGNVTARHFQSKGWNVIATMRSPEKDWELGLLENVLVTRLDVQDGGSILAAVNAGIACFGSIDVLVNNAGYGLSGPLEATSLDKIRRQFDTNVIGLIETTKAVLPHWRANKTGTVINISSPAGVVGFPLNSLYCASKFAVEGLSKALSFELDAIGVTVKLVTPGNMDTDFSGRSFDFNNDVERVEYQSIVDKFGLVRRNFSRGANPQIVAQVIYQAATDGSKQLRYVAGEDAELLIAAQKSTNDEQLMAGIKSQFGL